MTKKSTSAITQYAYYPEGEYGVVAINQRVDLQLIDGQWKYMASDRDFPPEEVEKMIRSLIVSNRAKIIKSGGFDARDEILRLSKTGFRNKH